MVVCPSHLGPVGLESRHAVWRDTDLPGLCAANDLDVLAGGETGATLLVDSHLHILVGRRGSGGAGIGEVGGLVDVEDELILLLGLDGDLGGGSLDGLTKCCWRRHIGQRDVVLFYRTVIVKVSSCLLMGVGDRILGNRQAKSDERSIERLAGEKIGDGRRDVVLKMLGCCSRELRRSDLGVEVCLLRRPSLEF